MSQYLLLRNDVKQGIFSSLTDVAYYLGISVSGTGVVKFMDKVRNPKYVTDPDESTIVGNHWPSSEEIIKNFARNHMKLPRDYELYRIEK